MAVTTGAGAGGTGRIAERLAAALARRTVAGEAQHLGPFAAQLLARAQAYVAGIADEETVQLVLSAFRFFQAPGPLPRVRVVTPTYVDEGWDAPWTIVETCLADRPFIVDTIREELRARGLEIRALLHPILAVTRDATGRAVRVEPPTHGAVRESFLHVAVPRIADPAAVAALADAIRARVGDLVLVTEDFGLQLARAQAIATDFEQLGRSTDPRLAGEATAVGDFLRWLVDGGFVFLGYREYGVDGTGDARTVSLRAGSGLGLLRHEERSRYRTPQPVATLGPSVRRGLLGGRLFTATKTRAPAPVHRRIPMDDLAFAILDGAGTVVGARRFIGLFTSKAHAEEAAEIPWLRRMLRQIVAAEGVMSGSHDWREIVGVFNTLPKSELFASTAEEIRADIATILAAERTTDVVVTVREGSAGDRIVVLVVMPRSRVSGEARSRVVSLVCARLGVSVLDDHLHAGDVEAPTSRARLHLAFTRGDAVLDERTITELCAAVDAVLERWSTRLRAALVARYGDDGAALAAFFADAFPSDYTATTPIERAVEDVRLANAAAQSGTPQIALDPEPVDGATVLRVYLAREPLVLADFLPLLDHAGLRALVEDRVRVDPASSEPVFVHRFLVQDRGGKPLDVARAGERIVTLLLAVRAGRVPSDVLNRLVVETDLDWRAVDCLRAYAGYAVQAGLGARREVWATLAGNPEPARRLFACFAARFGAVEAPDAATEFVASLDAVVQLREDLCLRGLAALVQATVRTTFFARAADVDRLVLKLRAADVPFLTDPRPRYETYVRAPIVEGLHLRAGLVARGGIRLSDRPDDFRTEVLGLMRTQTMKNAIIVPTGAKGAFVPVGAAAPIEAYREFIRGLLDVADDVVDGAVVHPRDVVVLDEEDPYLVVAADKGTASFSDAANALALERGFWLGDAFASGGSHGYDHKALGITARGAWECVRMHFREVDVDADTARLRVAGIGDMAGDVFGNGLLRSPHVELVAAFNHKHVFLDPSPDPAASFAERRRLFATGGGWDAYDPAVRSPGALVALRAAKRVPLTPEVRTLLGVTDDALSGEALVRAALGLEADLLWNGGIGTYVRAPDEADAAVGDPANDAVRVPATALRSRVVAEGGNLGVTQRGRVAYALAGGRINVDAVDNSAGVDLSDHEVNLKICLAPLVASGRLTVEARNALLTALVDDVGAHVLAHNATQSRLLTLDQRRSQVRLDDFRLQLAAIERALGVPRARLGLPDWESLQARQASSPGLTRPELAVLAAWTKIELGAALRDSALPEDPALEAELFAYFPERMRREHPDAIRGHRLRREIVTVQVVNTLVDEGGTTFAHRLARASGASLADVVRAFAIAWRLARGTDVADAIRAARMTLSDEVATALVLEDVLARTTRWVLARGDATRAIGAVVADLDAAIEPARDRLPAWLVGVEAEALHRRRAELEVAGMAPAAAADLAAGEWLPSLLDVATLARDERAELEAVARRYYGLAAEIDFGWLDAQLAATLELDPWGQRALEGVADDVRAARRRLARAVDVERRAVSVTAVRRLVDEVKAGGRPSLPALVVVAREIGRLSGGIECAA
jgi:glutamate dehydrogenase